MDVKFHIWWFHIQHGCEIHCEVKCEKIGSLHCEITIPGHFWRCAKIALGDALALQRSTSSAVSHLRSTTATCGSAPQQPELPCDLVRGRTSDPTYDSAYVLRYVEEYCI